MNDDASVIPRAAEYSPSHMHALTRQPTLPLYKDLPNVRRDLASLLPLPGPMAVQIQTVAACTFSCGLCPVSTDAHDPRGQMSVEDFGIILGKLHASGVLKVVRPFGLGEPLLDPTIAEKCAMVAALGGVRSELTSNASRLTPALARALILSGLQYLRWSIYGTTDKNLTEYIGRTRYTVEDIRLRVQSFRRIRDELGSLTPLIHIDALPWQEHEIAERFFGSYDSIGSAPRHNWATFESEQANALTGTKHVCPYPFYTLQVRTNGDCYPCVIEPDSLCVGNLLTQSLDEVWNGDAMQAIRQAHLDRQRERFPACGQCNFIQMTRDSLEDYRP